MDLVSHYCNGLRLKLGVSIYWRASLVPAAAVIPAPKAHIKVVAVKKFVVGFFVTHFESRTRVSLVVLWVNWGVQSSLRQNS